MSATPPKYKLPGMLPRSPQMTPDGYIDMSDDENAHMHDDLKIVRDAKRTLISKGLEALDEMSNLARDSEHPRAYEVLFNGIGKIREVSDALVDDARKRQVILENEKNLQNIIEGNARNITDNKDSDDDRIVYQGTTSDLIKMIHARKEKLKENKKEKEDENIQ